MVAKTIKLPNLRKIFKPDPGYIICDADLAGADAQVVAWDAGAERLKNAFKAGLKVHVENAKTMFGALAGEDGKKEPYYTKTKAGVHGTNYGGTAGGMARTLGWTKPEMEAFQQRWFEANPEIPEWHERTWMELTTTRTVTNAFGYRRIYYDRLVRSLLPEALAWKPQSTIAIVTEQAGIQMEERMPEVQLLLQVHDSWVMQWPRRIHSEQLLQDIAHELSVTIPYEDPLTIAWELNWSDKSWGDCKG